MVSRQINDIIRAPSTAKDKFSSNVEKDGLEAKVLARTQIVWHCNTVGEK